MGVDPDVPPTFWDRRRLLLALGAAAVNLAVLERLDLTPSRSAEADSTNIFDGGLGSQSPGGNDVEVGGWPRARAPARPQAGPVPGPDHTFDLVITGGRVLDPETGFDGLLDIGIDAGKITALAPPNSERPLRGGRRLNAEGLVVGPGFIDLLSYEPNSFGAWLKLADGVTTNLAMHGVNNYARAFFGRYGGKTPIHFGGAFHHHFLRGFDLKARPDRPLSPRQLTSLVELAGNNLALGFAGISFAPEYSPGTTRAEMTALAEVAAERGHATFFHVRYSDPFPPGTGLEAIQEVLQIGADTGAPVHIQHVTSTGGTYEMEAAISLVGQARSDGLDVTACIYPYDFWGTFLASSRFSAGWEQRFGIGVGDLQVAGTNRRLTQETFVQAKKENRLVAALGSIPEDEVVLALRQPWVMVASDGIPTSDRNNHPRGAGTFSRLFARYVRDTGVLDLMTALAKVTILPAARTETMIPAMANKGRVQRGADADLVVFDPVYITDNATVADPSLPSVGVRHVVVAGQLALVDGEPDRKILAGQPLLSAAADPSSGDL